MSLLRDTKYVKTLSKLTDSGDVMDDACRMILSDVELKLRVLINESIKYMKHFNNEELTHNDVNSALQDLNEFNKLNGLKQPYQNKYQKVGRTWKLENKQIEITEEMKNIEIKDFKDIYPLGLELDWMSIAGRIPENEDNTGLRNKHKTVADNPLQPSLRPLARAKNAAGSANFELANLQIGNNGESLSIKEIRPNVLSVESEKFLTSFFRILDEQIKLIDEGENKLGFSKFLNVIDVIQKNPKMQILVPFIIDHINKNYDKVILNGALKKNLYIMIIDALFKNIKVNLEFHKHILIKILDHFLTSPKISLNMNRNELILRENAAKLLAKIILMNDDLKYINLKPHLFDLLCKKLVMLVDGFNEKNYGIIHGIFKFFGYMDSVTIKTYLMDFIYDILDNPKFKKIFEPLQNDTLTLKQKLSLQNNGTKDDQNLELTNMNNGGLFNKKSALFGAGTAKSQNNQSFSIFVIFDSFLVCIKKVLQLLFIDKKKEAEKLYASLYDRLGESVLPLINGSYMQLVRGFRRDSMQYHLAKKQR